MLPSALESAAIAESELALRIVLKSLASWLLETDVWKLAPKAQVMRIIGGLKGWSPRTCAQVVDQQGADQGSEEFGTTEDRHQVLDARIVTNPRNCWGIQIAWEELFCVGNTERAANRHLIPIKSMWSSMDLRATVDGKMGRVVHVVAQSVAQNASNALMLSRIRPSIAETSTSSVRCRLIG